jgi:hypothetical protein
MQTTTTNSCVSAKTIIDTKSNMLCASICISQLKSKMEKDELYKLIRVAMEDMYNLGHKRGLRDGKYEK